VIRCAHIFVLGAVFLLAAPAFSQQIPPTHVSTLAGSRLVLPEPAGSRPLIVLVTFSHKGSDDAVVWNKDFKVPYETDRRVDYAELADFQGVPSFVMKMILHGMRRSVQEPEKSHLGLLYSDEDGWKKLVGFRDPDITYVVVAAPDGHVVWQTKGPATGVKAAALEDAIAHLLLPRS